MDVRQQVIPTDDTAVGVTRWESARLEPPIFTIGPTKAMLNFVRRTRLYGVLPGCDHTREFGRVHRIRRTPFLQFLKRATEVIKDPPVDVRDSALACHYSDESRNRFDDEGEVFFIAEVGDRCRRICAGSMYRYYAKSRSQACL